MSTSRADAIRSEEEREEDWDANKLKIVRTEDTERTTKTLREGPREDLNTRAAKLLKSGKLGTLSTPSGRRALRSMLKYHAAEKAMADAEKKECDAEEQHYGPLPDSPAFNSQPFDERQFGDLVTPDVSRHFPCSVVSLALFDGDTKLFACSAIPLPPREAALVLTRYVTSARFVIEYRRHRYRDDKLRIEVCLPNGKKKDGFLELHNASFAIVTSVGEQYLHPLNLELQIGPRSLDGEMQVAGRAFESGCLMAAKVELVSRYVATTSELVSRYVATTSLEYFSRWKSVKGKESGPVAVLGGPVLTEDNRIIGINLDVCAGQLLGTDASVYVSYASLPLLRTSLEHFQILNPKELHFRGYSLPHSTDSMIPSGFMRRINRIRHYGYPMPPPLLLQLNGELRNNFEECFGEPLAWKGYPYNVQCYINEGIWRQLRKDVVKDISRRVVSIASYYGYERYFVCTGLLIKWHRHTLVLTSASLVRSRNNQDEIDNSLKIQVFLPPKQRAIGKLEFYSLNYNIAILSVEKKFTSISPEDISNKNSAPKSSGKVVAVGRDSRQGLLMASIGEVKRRDKGCKLDCKDLKLSTCKIKKVGIGGPLVNFDGSFVGMNHFDERMLTPFLPRNKIAQVLESITDLPLPSEREDYIPEHLEDAGGESRKNRWPVPEPYWYHGLLDVGRYEHKHIGRRLQ